MKPYLFAILTIFYVASIQHSFCAPARWHVGELTLRNGTTLRGQLSYNPQADVVQCQQPTTTNAFSAMQISEFRYFDEGLNTLQKFVARSFPMKNGRQKTVLLEEFISGPITVYRRFQRVPELFRALPSATPYNTETTVDNVEEFDYYVAADDNLLSLTDFTRAYWPQKYNEFPAALQRYVATLPVTASGTLVDLLLINQYNHLKIKQNTSPATPLFPTITAGH